MSVLMMWGCQRKTRDFSKSTTRNGVGIQNKKASNNSRKNFLAWVVYTL